MPTVELCYHESHTSHMSAEAHECPACHCMRYFWANRAGQTVCIYCDTQGDQDAKDCGRD